MGWVFNVEPVVNRSMHSFLRLSELQSLLYFLYKATPKTKQSRSRGFGLKGDEGRKKKNRYPMLGTDKGIRISGSNLFRSSCDLPQRILKPHISTKGKCNPFVLGRPIKDGIELGYD